MTGCGAVDVVLFELFMNAFGGLGESAFCVIVRSKELSLEVCNDDTAISCIPVGLC